MEYTREHPQLVQEDFNLERYSHEIKEPIDALQKKIKKKREQMSMLQEELKPITRSNNLLKREVDNLDNKIKSCINNKQLQIGKSAASGQLNVIDEKGDAGVLKNREVYEEMFYILWRNPRYLATITPSVKIVDRSEFVHTINNDLWSDHFDSTEDQVLLTLFKKVIDADFKQASSDGDIGSVFRGNTVVTLMLSLYCNRTNGLQALKTVLWKPLKDLIENEDLNLEIDAVKVYKQIAQESGDEKFQEGDALTPEKALANSRVQALRKTRMKDLRTITQKIFDRITETVDEIPYGIRFICKQVAESAHRHFPKCSKDEIGRLIGGYIFLRFFNPVIVQPARANMFRGSKLKKRQQRNLILVTRVLQSQSNGSSFRDQMMLELNKFLEANREQTLQYFQRLIEIDSLEDTIEIDSMLDSAKRRQPSITLKCNQIYLFHRLIYENKNRWDVPDDPVLQCIVRIGKPPKTVSRSKDFEVVLKLHPPESGTLSDDEKNEFVSRSRLFQDIEIKRRSTLGNAAAAVSDKMPIWSNLHHIFHSAEYPGDFLKENNKSLLSFLEKLLLWARSQKSKPAKPRCDGSIQYNFGCAPSAETGSAPASRQGTSRRVIFGSYPGAIEQATQRKMYNPASLASEIQKCMDSINKVLVLGGAKKSRKREYNEFLQEYVRYVKFLTFCDRRSTKKLQKMEDAKVTMKDHQKWLREQKEAYIKVLETIQPIVEGMGSHSTEKRKSFVRTLKRSVSIFGSKMNSGRNDSDQN